MKGKDMIHFIEKNGLEEFELQFSVTQQGEVFPDVETFKLTGVSDIGYSDKTIDFEGDKIER